MKKNNLYFFAAAVIAIIIVIGLLFFLKPELKPEMTSSECTAMGGRVVNTLSGGGCGFLEESLGTVTGLKCPCVCCKIAGNNEWKSQFCNQDSDCILEPELWPNCYNFCEGSQCTADTPLCKAYYKYSSENIEFANANCFFSTPCKKPEKVECVDNLCTAVEPEHNEEFSQFCNQASDCAAIPELSGSCWHYCQDMPHYKECTPDLELCKVYYKYSEGNKKWADIRCGMTHPCKEPSAIQCINSLCVAEG